MSQRNPNLEVTLPNGTKVWAEGRMVFFHIPGKEPFCIHLDKIIELIQDGTLPGKVIDHDIH